MSSEGLTAESEKLLRDFDSGDVDYSELAARLWMIERTVRYAAQPAAGEGLDVEALVRRLDSAKRRGPLTANMIPFNMGVASAQDVLRAVLQSSQAAPVASRALDDEIRSFVANVETAAEDNGTPAVLIADLWALARDRIRDRDTAGEPGD